MSAPRSTKSSSWSWTPSIETSAPAGRAHDREGAERAAHIAIDHQHEKRIASAMRPERLNDAGGAALRRVGIPGSPRHVRDRQGEPGEGPCGQRQPKLRPPWRCCRSRRPD